MNHCIIPGCKRPVDPINGELCHHHLREVEADHKEWEIEKLTKEMDHDE